MVVGRKVRYSGRVQGVGFRYTACRIAEGFAVSGYVKNLPNGDVELVAEGEVDSIDPFLASIADALEDYIVQTSVEDQTALNFKGFRVRH